MHSVQLERLGFQVTEGMELMLKAQTYFVFRNHMVRIYQPANDQLAVDVYSKQKESSTWSEFNRNLLHCCKTIDEAIDFIINEGTDKKTSDFQGAG